MRAADYGDPAAALNVGLAGPDARGVRIVRRWLALGLSVWTLLLVAVMVKKAVEGGPPEYAGSFLRTGILATAIGALAWCAWRSYVRLRAEQEWHRREPERERVVWEQPRLHELAPRPDGTDERPSA